MSELQTLESIIAGKPGGATHKQDGGKYYYKIEGNSWYIWVKTYQSREKKDKLRWVIVYGLMPMRSLSDIQTQISQLKEIEDLKLDLEEQYNNSEDKYVEFEDTIDSLNEQLASAKADGIREFLIADWKIPERSKTGEYTYGVKDMIQVMSDYVEQLGGKK
jgi:hypothetical protein